ncbi:dTDP-4-dehydrorhamnose 3,5-epimerase [Acerihabitans sp. KWT182]|uniref:dTDP-4-dehydrorhamnose 3,5-epimerase n=1 Tax=Acerihabitans sp. KWT182 TaxID=3157919 RepID=A0AAU7QBW0_9GAMM
MKPSKLPIPDVILFEPQIFKDERGYFFESFQLEKFQQAVNRKIHFVQSNESLSKRNVIRGLHYQVSKPQGKLVRVVKGTVFDVAVDLRKNSPTFGQWAGALLSDENFHQLWIPEGFAHGFLVISDSAKLQYMVTDYWYPQYDRCIRFNDPDIDIKWQDMAHTDIDPIISFKDQSGDYLVDAEVFLND